MRSLENMFRGTGTTEIYTLSLRDALPIFQDTAASGIRCASRAPKAKALSKDGLESTYINAGQRWGGAAAFR